MFLPGASIQTRKPLSELGGGLLNANMVSLNPIQLANYLANKHQETKAEIARELHDDLGNDIAALRLVLLRLKNSDSGAAVTSELSAALETVESLGKASHRIMMGLRPPNWGHGLQHTVHWLCKDFERRHTISLQLQLELDLESKASGQRLDPVPGNDSKNPIHHTLYRVLQEALSNVVKHAQASRVVVSLQRTVSHYHLSVADDGVGLASDALTKSNAFGLKGMQARANALGGEIQWLVEEGTQVMLTIPYRSI